jgi:proliferating cell nuclear antigen
MRCVINGGKLKRFVSVIEPIATGVVVECKDGWHVKCVDPAHVAMLTLDVERGWFDEASNYEGVFTLELGKVKEFLSIVGTKADVEMSTGGGRLTLKAGGLNRRMSMPELAVGEVKVPGFTLPATFDVDASVLIGASRASAGIADHLRMSVGEGRLLITAGDESDSLEVSIPMEHIGESVMSLFPLDYFSGMVKALPPGECTVGLGNDMPLSLTFGDGEGLAGRYLLAPRIEQE